MRPSHFDRSQTTASLDKTNFFARIYHKLNDQRMQPFANSVRLLIRASSVRPLLQFLRVRYQGKGKPFLLWASSRLLSGFRQVWADGTIYFMSSISSASLCGRPRAITSCVLSGEKAKL